MKAAETIYNEKIQLFQNAINNIYYSLNNYNKLNIINTNDYNNCLESLEKVVNLINTINSESIISDLQYINNGLSSIIKNYGIYNIDYLFNICLSNDYLKGKEYDFNYITHISVLNDNLYFGLYNFIIIELDESTTKFIKNEDEQ